MKVSAAIAQGCSIGYAEHDTNSRAGLCNRASHWWCCKSHTISCRPAGPRCTACTYTALPKGLHYRCTYNMLVYIESCFLRPYKRTNLCKTIRRPQSGPTVPVSQSAQSNICGRVPIALSLTIHLHTPYLAFWPHTREPSERGSVRGGLYRMQVHCTFYTPFSCCRIVRRYK